MIWCYIVLYVALGCCAWYVHVDIHDIEIVSVFGLTGLSYCVERCEVHWLKCVKVAPIICVEHCPEYVNEPLRKFPKVMCSAGESDCWCAPSSSLVDAFVIKGLENQESCIWSWRGSVLLLSSKYSRAWYLDRNGLNDYCYGRMRTCSRLYLVCIVGQCGLWLSDWYLRYVVTDAGVLLKQACCCYSHQSMMLWMALDDVGAADWWTALRWWVCANRNAVELWNCYTLLAATIIM